MKRQRSHTNPALVRAASLPEDGGALVKKASSMSAGQADSNGTPGGIPIDSLKLSSPSPTQLKAEPAVDAEMTESRNEASATTPELKVTPSESTTSKSAPSDPAPVESKTSSSEVSPSDVNFSEATTESALVSSEPTPSDVTAASSDPVASNPVPQEVAPVESTPTAPSEAESSAPTAEAESKPDAGAAVAVRGTEAATSDASNC